MHVSPNEPPRPAELQHLRPSDAAGLTAFGAVVLATALAVGLSLTGRPILWLAGQLLMALAFVQWFVLLHECGHDTLFRTRRLHAIAGRVAAFFSIIPYAS